MTTLLRLRTSPIAVKIVRRPDDFPDDVIHPVKDLGIKIAVCQAMGMARRFGWTVAIEPKESICPSATMLFGWADLRNKKDLAQAYEDLAKSWIEMGFAQDIRSTMKSVEDIPRFRIGECRGLVFSPLESTKIIPDLVLLYCDSAQAMNLIHGCTFRKGGNLTFSTQARCACIESIVPTVLAKEPYLAIPCGGDRGFEMTQDDEMIFTVPAHMANDVILTIRKRRKKGYHTIPVNRNIVFEPKMTGLYGKLNQKLKPI